MDGIPAPNPIYKIPIKNVTGNANVKIQNRNLLPELWWNGNVKTLTGNGITATINEDNTITLTGTATARSLFYFKPFNLTFKAGTYQYISNAPAIDLRIESTLITDGAIAYANSFNDIPFERTAQESFEITGSVLVIAEGQSTNTTLHLMLQQKNSNTSYVPHREQNLPFTFSEGQFLADNEKLQDNGMLKKWKKVIFDGTENWRWNDTKGGAYCDSFRNIIYSQAKSYANAVCNYFILNKNQTWVNNHFGFNDTGTTIWFLNTSKFSSLSEWTSWLAEQYANGTPVTVEYELATEEIIPYNETQASEYNAIKQAHTYKDVTYISSESDELSPLLDIQYWKERGAEE